MIDTRAPSVTEVVCGRTAFMLVPEAPARALHPAVKRNVLPWRKWPKDAVHRNVQRSG